MRPKYRVEAYIVPKAINEDELSTSNEIDDVKVANNKLKLESPLKDYESTFIESNIASTISHEPMNNAEPVKSLLREIYDINEPIYDVPCNVKAKFQTIPPQYKYDDKVLLLPPKIPVRTSSLMSIDERGENDGILEEFCFHGYKNGCTAAAQRPEQVSEEIFQDNWLRRLEILREREGSLGEKEILLQERERLLFKKERELRILERLVRDKLKQADLRLKLCQSSQSIESNFDTKTRSSEGSQNSQGQRSRMEKSLSCNFDVKTSNDEKFSGRDGDTEHKKISRLVTNNDNFENRNLKNPPNSKSSLCTNSTSLVPANDQFLKLHGESMKNSFPSIGAYSSLRTSRPKIRPKISYDDLDSTLSADIGDSSFVVTSRKFDPTVFKKPHAFMRSASERRTRHEHQDPGKESIPIKYPQHSAIHRNSQDDKILKRVGENIIISQQDEKIRYQDYGLIDERVNPNDNDEVRNSYLNLERGVPATRPEKNSRNYRDRPVSWNEETNEWLRKKRQAYNIATMRIPNENFENKENADAVNGGDKLKKTTKKKDSRTKKFGIFR